MYVEKGNYPKLICFLDLIYYWRDRIYYSEERKNIFSIGFCVRIYIDIGRGRRKSVIIM